MKKIYETGLDSNEISMSVSVGTVGVAYTSATLTHIGGTSAKIAESDAKSGNISKRKIGTALALRKSFIMFRTLIDFSHLTENERESAVSNLSLKYEFEGGFSGKETYKPDPDDLTVPTNMKTVSVTKIIELK